MPEQTNELKKMAAIAVDLELSSELRTDAIKLLGRMGSREALLTLLALAANEGLINRERDLALKQAREIIKSGR